MGTSSSRRIAAGHRRRLLLVAAQCALFAAPRAVWAQRPQPVRRIGFLSPTTRGPRNEAFVQGMRDLGYVDGRDVIVETRFADGRAERLPALASEMLGLNVEVLVAGSTIGARAAKNATATVPIVFAGSSDPVAGGIVSNLARPQGNITGLSLDFGDAVAGKMAGTAQRCGTGRDACRGPQEHEQFGRGPLRAGARRGGAQPTRFDLVVNLRTARAFDLALPQRGSIGRVAPSPKS